MKPVILLCVFALSVSCATALTPIVAAAKDCGAASAKSAIDNVVPTVAIVLTAAADGDWLNALVRLAATWGADGLSFVTCAVHEVQAHYASNLAKLAPPTHNVGARATEWGVYMAELEAKKAVGK